MCNIYTPAPVGYRLWPAPVRVKGVVVGFSRTIFCMEFVELTLLILNNFRLFGFGAWGKSYGVYKPKFRVFDRHLVKMASRHVVMTNR